MPGRKLKQETELFYTYLRQNGLKKTYQKDLILETFLNTEGHLSVEDIYSLVRKRDRKVGIVTVFRTLKSLTACGIAREITLGDGLTRFEHSYHHPHHHHIICTECNKAIEFISPELERIQEEIVRKYRFQPFRQRFQIFGQCEDCREHRPLPESHKYDTRKIFARDALRMALFMEQRGLQFYREAAERNQDASGSEVFRQIASEEERHLAELQSELERLMEAEKGIELAPEFLHFDAEQLEQLIPRIGSPEQRDIRLDTRDSLELAMKLEENAARFFTDYAHKFIDTEGKNIFLRFAQEELKHLEAIKERLGALTAFA